MDWKMGCACAAALWAFAAQAADVASAQLRRPEGLRGYLRVTPQPLPAGKRPLVILLHGHGGSARQLLGLGTGAAPLSQWMEIADREGVLLVAPDGARGGDGKAGWHDCRLDAASSPQTDDVGLIAAIIRREVAERDADPARVYAMGMSNGGMMAFRLASELGGSLAAFATVGASMARRSGCAAPSHPLSALIVAGTADPVVPYAGGPVSLFGGKGRGEVIAVADSASFWRRLDQLPDIPHSSAQLPHSNADDPTRATLTQWGEGGTARRVLLLTISGGGHVEPSIAHRVGPLYVHLLGHQSADAESAELAWKLFRDQRRP
ncbi:alpha/beta hydrolase family esterase [Chromobacterium violaceum]|uniref:alpha/beta hydrolase family esterase n=1 Tax=Chromobacterium violaceum TaxID=536 RepID=UPI0012FD00B9|nr:PHB depolymerase family esterase [Chromobacterium violaceum]